MYLVLPLLVAWWVYDRTSAEPNWIVAYFGPWEATVQFGSFEQFERNEARLLPEQRATEIYGRHVARNRAATEHLCWSTVLAWLASFLAVLAGRRLYNRRRGTHLYGLVFNTWGRVATPREGSPR